METAPADNGFTLTLTAKTQGETHYWNLGNGLPVMSGGAEMSTVSHTFTSRPSAFSVKHSVNGEDWCEKEADELPSAKIIITCNGVFVEFIGLSHGIHQWVLSDGRVFTANSNDPVNPTNKVLVPFGDINPFQTPITYDYSVSGFLYFNDEPIPFDAAFIGSGCGSIRSIKKLVLDGILPSSQTNIPKMYVFGNLNADIAYSFLGTNIIMFPGGKIAVTGNPLTLANNVIIGVRNFNDQGMDNVCLGPWIGIEVYSQGRLIIESATIDRAVYGIRPINNEGPLGMGPILSLSGAKFTNNFVGIRATDGWFTLAKFVNNSFQGGIVGIPQDCASPDPIDNDTFTYNSFSGIYVKGSSGARFAMPNGSNNNKFLDLPRGIESYGENLLVRGCTFESNRYGIYFYDNHVGNHSLIVYGNGGNVKFADNCDVGISALTAKLGTSIYIQDCLMSSVQNGIDIREVSGNFREITVENNLISCSKYSDLSPIGSSTGIWISDKSPVYTDITAYNNAVTMIQPRSIPTSLFPVVPTGLNPIGIFIQALLPQDGISNSSLNLIADNNTVHLNPGYYGIILENVAGAQVHDNNVANLFGNISDIVRPQFGGIRSEGGIYNNFYCNTVTHNDSDFSMGGITSRGSIDVAIRSNTLTDLSNAIQILNDNGTACDIASNSIVNSSGVHRIGIAYAGDSRTGPQYLRGNLWVGDLLVGALFPAGGGGFSYCSSRYHVSPNANVADGTDNPVNAPLYGCGTLNAMVPWFTILPEAESMQGCQSSNALVQSNLNEAEISIASGEAENLPPGSAWSAESDLYRRIRENPLTKGSGLIAQNFAQAKQNQAVGQMDVVRMTIGSLGLFSTELSEGILQKQLLDIASMEQLAIEQALSVSNSESIQKAIDLRKDETATLIAQANADLFAKAGALQAINAAITCTAQPCFKEQWFNDLYLECEIKSLRTPTANEINLLGDLAASCPSDNGPVVYQARTWYHLLTGFPANYVCNEEIQQIEQKSASTITRDKATDLRLQPNPADESTVVSLPILEQGGFLLLQDMLGHVFQRIALTPGTETQSFPTKGLNQGLYLVRGMDLSRR